jgi:hypothetical protein
MNNHLIIEGMDGSGKDTLINTLMAYKHWDKAPQLHDRASTSLGGPLPRLDEWVIRDMEGMPSQRFSIYNRHPLISEPIYAPYRLVNRGMSGLFATPSWVQAQRKELCKSAVVVWCVPSWQTVHTNLMKAPMSHMPGVIQNAHQLYVSYIRTINEWKGPYVRYNYETIPVRKLITYVRSLLTTDVRKPL